MHCGGSANKIQQSAWEEFRKEITSSGKDELEIELGKLSSEP